MNFNQKDNSSETKKLLFSKRTYSLTPKEINAYIESFLRKQKGDLCISYCMKNIDMSCT